MTFVVVGTGRSGTKYVARALTASGIPTGHECVYRATAQPKRSCPDNMMGDASWLAVPHLPDVAVPIVHAHRHPLLVLSSMVRKPLRLHSAWGRYFLRHYDPPSFDPHEFAVWAFAIMTRQIEAHATLAVRVEDREQAIARIAEHVGLGRSNQQLQAASRIPSTTNQHHNHRTLTWSAFPAGPDLDVAKRIASQHY